MIADNVTFFQNIMNILHFKCLVLLSKILNFDKIWDLRVILKKNPKTPEKIQGKANFIYKIYEFYFLMCVRYEIKAASNKTFSPSSGGICDSYTQV